MLVGVEVLIFLIGHAKDGNYRIVATEDQLLAAEMETVVAALLGNDGSVRWSGC